MTSYGVTAAGFSLKPVAAILADMQASVLSNIDAGLDLTPTSPDGQMLGVLSNALGELWELAETCYNADNRGAVEGAGLDALGAMTGTLREGEDYTQVACTLTISAANAPYAPDSLVASVAGDTSFTFANVKEIQALDIVGGIAANVLFQAQAIGATPTVNAGTLTTIVNPVTGWTAITNPEAQVQLGVNAELDAVYANRQDAEIADLGSCNESATAAALYAMAANVYGSSSGAAIFSASILENRTDVPVTTGPVTLPPRSFAVIVYDEGGGISPTTIAQTIWANKPAGISTVGTTSGVIEDPFLGEQAVSWIVPTPKPLYVSGSIYVRPGYDFATVNAACQTALAEAAIAPTPANDAPPVGQLTPGTPVIGSQLEGVLIAVPGVMSVPTLAFDFVASPTNTATLPLDPTEVATIATANVILTQAASP